MHKFLTHALGIAAAAAFIAGSAQAQSTHTKVVVHKTANGEVVVTHKTQPVVVNARTAHELGVAPGHARKVYNADQGASMLRDMFSSNGYTVTRIVPSGTSRYVYYRSRDGVVHRAIVRPGTERLSFTNVPSPLLQKLLSRLY